VIRPAVGWLIGRDPVAGSVWLPTPALSKGGGPERVTSEEPPEDWQPQPFLGFTGTHAVDQSSSDPAVWDGDQA
jgi:hypothetical protein